MKWKAVKATAGHWGLSLRDFATKHTPTKKKQKKKLIMTS